MQPCVSPLFSLPVQNYELFQCHIVVVCACLLAVHPKPFDGYPSPCRLFILFVHPTCLNVGLKSPRGLCVSAISPFNDGHSRSEGRDPFTAVFLSSSFVSFLSVFSIPFFIVLHCPSLLDRFLSWGPDTSCSCTCPQASHLHRATSLSL